MVRALLAAVLSLVGFSLIYPVTHFVAVVALTPAGLGVMAGDASQIRMVVGAIIVLALGAFAASFAAHSLSAVLLSPPAKMHAILVSIPVVATIGLFSFSAPTLARESIVDMAVFSFGAICGFALSALLAIDASNRKALRPLA